MDKDTIHIESMTDDESLTELEALAVMAATLTTMAILGKDHQQYPYLSSAMGKMTSSFERGLATTKALRQNDAPQGGGEPAENVASFLP